MTDSSVVHDASANSGHSRLVVEARPLKRVSTTRTECGRGPEKNACVYDLKEWAFVTIEVRIESGGVG